MKHLKRFNEGYNLETLKAWIDTGNKLWVKIENYPNEEFEVMGIEVTGGVEDGTLSLRPASDEGADVWTEFTAQGSEITKTITPSEKRRMNENNDYRERIGMSGAGKLTDEEWVQLTELTVENIHQAQRMGQAYMNALHVVSPELYNDITGTDNDPFYDDRLIINLLNYLNEE